MQLSTQVLLAGALLALSASTSAVPVPVSGGGDLVLLVVRDLSRAPVAGGDGILWTRGPVRLHSLDAEERRVPMLLPRVGGQGSALVDEPLLVARGGDSKGEEKALEQHIARLRETINDPSKDLATRTRAQQSLRDAERELEYLTRPHAPVAGTLTQLDKAGPPYRGGRGPSNGVEGGSTSLRESGKPGHHP